MHQCVRCVLLYLTLLSLLGLLGPAGCASPGPQAPAQWQPQRATTRDSAEFDRAGPALQVLICQGQVHGTHTGLRVLQPGAETVFWDPAGQFGIKREDLRRSRDVIAENAPSIAEYVEWRFHGAEDSAVALFEWRLTPQRARYFADILTHDAVVPEGEEEFETTTIGLFCCHAVCKYLDRFAKDEMTIPTFWYRPEHLGDHLWTQHPDRVAIFHDDGTIEVFTAPQH